MISGMGFDKARLTDKGQGAANSLPFSYQPCVGLYGSLYALRLNADAALSDG